MAAAKGRGEAAKNAPIRRRNPKLLFINLPSIVFIAFLLNANPRQGPNIGPLVGMPARMPPDFGSEQAAIGRMTEVAV
jgi:hypothetical protein